jgi:hypothetical protein
MTGCDFVRGLCLRLGGCVDLEILRDHFNFRANRFDESAVGRLCGSKIPGSRITRNEDNLRTCATSGHAWQGREKS